MAMVQVASDNFQRADVSPLGGNWTVLTGTGTDGAGQKIVSQNVEPVNANSNEFSVWNPSITAPGGTWPNDQYSEVTNGGLTDPVGNSYISADVRMSQGTGPNVYRFLIGIETNVNHYYIAKHINGVNTNLIGPIALTVSLNDVFRCQVVGTTISVFQNGTLLNSTTDASLSSGSPGMNQFTDQALTNHSTKIATWAAGANQSAAPTFSPNGGSFGTTQTVTISSTTPGGTIYYTTDGSTPTESSSFIANGGTVSVSTTLTLKAIASVSNFVDSIVSSASFIISGNAYSVPDCRVAPAGPNANRLVQATKIYDVQTSSNHIIPPTDSRIAPNIPVDSRVAANIPQNSRTPGTFGPGVN